VTGRTNLTSDLVYVSGPLWAAPDLDVARSFYEAIAHVCMSTGWTPYLPHMHTDPEKHPDTSDQEVFTRDIEALERATVLVADLRSPSLGVGAEIGIAYERGVPIIGLRGRDRVPSRFALGLLAQYERGYVAEVDKEDLGGLAICLKKLREPSTRETLNGVSRPH
jgi:nucleoside 2-deoxyribosyltransferase